MKRILLFLCLLSASLASTYADTDLSFSEGKALDGWGVEGTDSETNTVTFNGQWAHWGWELSSEGSNADFSGYDGYKAVEVKFTTNIATGYVELGAVYGDGSDNSNSTYINKDEADDTEYTLTYTFDDTKYSSVANIRLTVYDLSYGGDGLPHIEGQYWDNDLGSMVDGQVVNATVTITSAKLISKDQLPIVNVNNEAYINTYWPDQEIWNEKVSGNEEGEEQEEGQGGDDTESAETVPSGTITPSADKDGIPCATLDFKVNYGGLGWQYYLQNTSLNLSGYSGIEVEYTVSDYGESSEAPSVYLDLVSGFPADESTGTESSEHSTNDISGSDGKITFTFPTSTDMDNYIDPSNITQIVIKTSAPCTVTVKSIKLITTTIETSSANFIIEDDENYYLNLNVTKVGTWSGGVTDDSSEENTTVTSSAIEFTQEGQLIGFDYTDKDNSNKHLDLTSYTTEGDESGVTFKQLEVRYTVSSEAVRNENEDRFRVMLELMDADGNYNNIEVYDTYSIGRLIVNFDDYNESEIKFSNIQSITFSMEKVSAERTAVLNIESIRLLTEEQIPEAGNRTDTLLISQMYVTSTASSITPANTDDSIDKKAEVKSSEEWTLATWYFDDVSMDDYWGAEVNVTTSSKCTVRLEIVYANTIPSINNNCECISFHCDGTETTRTLLLPFIKNEKYTDNNGEEHDLDADVTQVYLIWGRVTDDDNTETDSIKFTINSARLLQKEAYPADYLTITINTDEGYGTYYHSTQPYKMPYGMQGTTITGIGDKDEGMSTDTEDYYTLSTSWEYTKNEDNLSGGVSVPANKPLLLQGSEDQNVILSFTAFYDDSSSDDGGSNSTERLAEDEGGSSTTTTNLLHGSDTQTTPATMKDITHKDEDSSYSGSENETAETVTDDDYYYYLFTYKTGTWSDTNNSYDNWPYSKLGFYWSSVYKGGPFASNAHRAWLALPKETVDNLKATANEGKTISFVFGDSSNDDNLATDNETTGIATIETAATADGKIYNLQGIRVNSMDKPGIYIVGGRKIVKK